MIHYIFLLICIFIGGGAMLWREYHFDRKYILFKAKYGIIFGYFLYVAGYWITLEVFYWAWFTLQVINSSY